MIQRTVGLLVGVQHRLLYFAGTASPKYHGLHGLLSNVP
jgi:hypothetical protein